MASLPTTLAAQAVTAIDVFQISASSGGSKKSLYFAILLEGNERVFHWEQPLSRVQRQTSVVRRVVFFLIPVSFDGDEDSIGRNPH